MQGKVNRASSVATAVLFVTLAFGVVPVAGAPVGDGVDIDIKLGDGSVLDSVQWLNDADRSAVFEMVVTPASEDQVTSTFFGVGTQDAVDHKITFADQKANGQGDYPDSWNAEIVDENEDGNPEGIFYEGPEPDFTCVNTGVGCPEDAALPLGPTSFFIQVSLDPVDGDFAPIEFSGFSQGDSHVADDSAKFSLGFDSSDAVIDAFQLSGGQTTATSTFTDIQNLVADYSVHDEGPSGVALVEYDLDSAGYTPISGTSGSIGLSGVGEGDHTIQLRVTDGAGNVVESATTPFSVDTIAPVISAVSLTSDNGDATLAKAGDTLTLTFDVSEPVMDPGVALTLDGATSGFDGFTLAGSTYTYKYGLGSDDNGPFAVTIDADDLAGNTAAQRSASGVDADTTVPTTTHVIEPEMPGSGGYYTTTPSVTLTCTDNLSGCAGAEYSVNGEPFQDYTGPFSLPEGDAVTYDYRSTDAAGNVESAPGPFFADVDTVPPTLDPITISSDNADGSLAKVGDTITVTFKPSELGTLTAASISGFDALGSEVDNGDDTLSVSRAVSGDEDEGPASFSLTFTDSAGHEGTATTADDGDVTIDTSGPNLATLGIASNGATSTEATVDDTITVTWTTTPEEDAASASGTINGESATIDGDSASVIVDGSWTEGPVDFNIQLFDSAGNPSSMLTQADVTDGSVVDIEFGDLVKTTVADIANNFVQTGDSTTITVDVVWDEDQGSIDTGDPYAFGRVGMFVDGSLSQTKTANSQGEAVFTVSSNDIASVDYVFKTTGFAPNANRVVTENGDLVGRTATVAYTTLDVVAFSVDDDVVSKDAMATLSVEFEWGHDNTEATGLDVSGLLLDVLGQGSGNDARDLVPDTAESGSIAAFTEVGNGVYETTYAHGAYESLKFSLAGGPIVGDVGGEPTNFDVPSSSDVYVHWIGAYVSDVSLENQGDLSDTTPEFVNLDDDVVPTATVVYTPNYDPNGPNGLLASGAEPATIENANVELFLTSFTDAAFVPQSHAAAANTDFDFEAVTSADGNAVLPALNKGNLQADTIRDGANVYGLRYFATDVPGIDEQQISASNAGDLDFENTLTLTALDLAYVADSATGVEDGDTTNGGTDRWWLGMDNAKGDADSDPDDLDAVGVDLEVTWRHDGTPAEDADVKVHDGTAFLADAGVDLAIATDAAGSIAGYSFDPDTFGLDARVQDLDFRAVSAPEPGTPTETISQHHDTFTQEMLWTRVALLMEFEPNADGEVDLGASTEMFFVPVYYHDENDLGRPYFFTEDYDAFDDGFFDFAGDVGYDATLSDDAMAALSTAATQTDPGAGLASFTVFAGCAQADLDVGGAACAAAPSIDEAGWHTYTAGMSVTPHDLPVDGADLDVLYTAVVIDAQTNRLTAPVGTDIDLEAQAFYAHTTDVAGAALSNVGFGAGNMPYTNGVVADVSLDGSPAAGYDDVAFDAAGGLAATVPSPTTAARGDILVDAVSLDDDGSVLPLSLVYDSATMERVWLSADTAIDAGRSDFTDRHLQVRGRDVEVYFDVAYTDGVTPTTVSDTNFGFAFTPEDDNPADRFDRTTGAGTAISTSPNTDPATAEVFAALDGATYPATFVTGEGSCDAGCWKATITGYSEVAADVDFGLGATIPLTSDTTDDIGTTVTVSEEDQFQVDFTAIELAVLGDGNTFYQDDLSEFWYNLGDDGTFQVEASWAHDDSPAAGATIGLDTTLVHTVTETGDPGTYDVVLTSPVDSDRATYDIAVSSVPSLVAGEADLIDGDPYNIGADSLTAALAQPTLVHTQAVLTWSGDYDGGFTNKAQSEKFDFQTFWEHDDTVIDVDHGWSLTANGEEFVAGVGAGMGGSSFDVTVTDSMDVALAPGLFVGPQVSAPRGIDAEVLPTTAPTVTWTAIEVDVDDDLSAGTYTAPETVNVAARAGLEHNSGDYLEAIQLKLVGTSQVTAAGGYLPDGGNGANVDLRVLAPASVDVHAEGISYTPAKLLAGASAITASVDDQEILTFQ